MQDGGGRRLTLGDLFSKEGVKEQRSPFHGWAIRHARNNLITTPVTRNNIFRLITVDRDIPRVASIRRISET